VLTDGTDDLGDKGWVFIVEEIETQAHVLCKGVKLSGG